MAATNLVSSNHEDFDIVSIEDALKQLDNIDPKSDKSKTQEFLRILRVHLEAVGTSDADRFGASVLAFIVFAVEFKKQFEILPDDIYDRGLYQIGIKAGEFGLSHLSILALCVRLHYYPDQDSGSYDFVANLFRRHLLASDVQSFVNWVGENKGIKWMHESNNPTGLH